MREWSRDVRSELGSVGTGAMSQDMQVCKAGFPRLWQLRVLKALLKCNLLQEALPQQQR